MAKYGYRDIVDVMFLDPDTNEQIIFLDYLKTSSQAFGSSKVYQTGGRGNPKLVGWSSDNAMRIEFSSALLTPELLAMLFGTTMETGAKSVPVNEVITATSATFELSATPVIGDTTPISIAYTIDGSVPFANLDKVAATPASGEFSISGTTVTLNSEYSSGGKFLVTYYKTSTASNKRVKFQSDKFVKSVKVVGSTLWKDSSNDKDYPCRMEIPLLSIEIDGMTLNSAATGDPSDIVFSGECLKASNSTDMIVYDIDSGEVSA